jgi:type IV pilus assembly protein PilC
VGRLFGTLRRAELVAFYEELALLIEYGTPLPEALGTLAQRVENPKLGRVIGEMADAVQRGVSFSEAAAEHPRYFRRVVISMFRAGEQSGTLVQTLGNIAKHGERIESLRHTTLTGLIYPVMVLILAILVTALGSSVFVASIKPVVESVGGEPPWTISVLLTLGAWLRSAVFWAAAVLVVAGIAVGWKTAMRLETVRLLRDRLLLHVPGVRGLVRHSLTAGFCRVFATMSQAGVSMEETLHAAQQTAGNEVLRRVAQRAGQAVREGRRMAPELRSSGLFPSVVGELVDVGEETGELGPVFERLADVYEDKLADETVALARLVTPALVVLLGFVVGFIMVSLLSTYVEVVDRLQEVGPTVSI